jgi:hypothetical protein
VEEVNVARRGSIVAALALLAAGCGGSSGPAGPVLDPGQVSFQQVQSSVLTPSCALSGCHGDAGAPFGLDLSEGEAYANLVGVAAAELPAHDRVDPGNADDSYLFMKITADPRIQGDPMPPGTTRLSTQRVQLIHDWIEQGANR